jgi:hypothetical protein
MLDLQQVILMLQAKSNARGYLTADQISATLPVDLVSVDDIETVMAELKKLGVSIVEHD